MIHYETACGVLTEPPYLGHSALYACGAAYPALFACVALQGFSIK